MTASQTRTTTILAAIAALAVAAFLTVNLSMAAFSSQVSTGSNSWQSATVELSSTQSGSVLFSEANIVPGYSDTQTFTVVNNSTVATEVGLHANVTGGLATYLVVDIEKEGDSVYSGPLSGVPDSFAAATTETEGAGDSNEWTITVSLPSSTGNAAQNIGGSAVFTWEARSL